MRKRAIGKIIACSIFAVIFSCLLAGGLILYHTGALARIVIHDPITGTVEWLRSTLTGLPGPKLSELDNLLPVVQRGYIPAGYAEGDGAYAEAPESIDVDWAAGAVVIAASDAYNEVRVSEFAGKLDPLTQTSEAPTYAMVHRMQDGKLNVRAHRPGFYHFTNNEKTLLITMPKTHLAELSLDVAATTITLIDLDVNTLDLDSAAVRLDIAGCGFDKAKLDLAAVEGGFTQCRIGELDMDCAAGEVFFALTNVPTKIDIDGAASDYRFTLPVDASFTAVMDSVVAKLEVIGFSNISQQKGKTIVGDGASEFRFDISAGTVQIAAEGKSASVWTNE